MSYDKSVKIMEKLKPFIAIIILVFVVLSTIGLWNYIHLQKEIKATCGYQPNEKVFCVCSKDFVSHTFTYNNPYFNNSLDHFLNLSGIWEE